LLASLFSSQVSAGASQQAETVFLDIWYEKRMNLYMYTVDTIVAYEKDG
jgi:hypothetical protein